MSSAQHMLGIPPPLDDDADDVAWALSTAAAQWNRGAFADAIVWLRRAIDSAISVGARGRASQLNQAAAALTERMLAHAGAPNAPGSESTMAGVDDLLANPGRRSIDVEFDDEPTTSMPAHNPFLQPDSVPPHEDPFSAPPPPRELQESLTTVITEPEPQEVTSGELMVDDSGELIVDPPLPPFDHVDAPTEMTSRDDEALEDAIAALESYPSQTTPSPALDAAPPPPAAGAPPPPPAMDAPPPPPARAAPPPPPRVAPPPPHRAPPPPPPVATPTPPPQTPVAPLVAPEDATEIPPADVPPPLEAPLPPDDAEVVLEGVSLAEVPGLEDLPPEGQRALVNLAQLERLDMDEEVSQFAVALVLEGWVSLMPAIADVACAHASVGDVVFTAGSLDEGIALRVVAGESDTRVAVWDSTALRAATSDCPWVADELRVVADRYQALAGAAMGPLGERLDDGLRQQVTSRCEVKLLLPGEVLVRAGEVVPGMHIVGGGRVELVAGEGDGEEVIGEFSPGDFLFANEVLSHGTVGATARAGKGGALVLFADRMAAHELLVSVPPLLEMLAS